MSQPFAITTILAAFISTSSALTAADDSLQFKITAKRDDDKVIVKVEKKTAIVSVKSPFGISQAIIERTNEKWPDDLMLRLHLKGLESFQVSNGKVTLNAAVSSHDDSQRIRLWKDGKENAPLDSKSPYWIEIRSIGSDGKPTKTIPLKDGYFEMMLPKAFMEVNPKSITMSWIDFLSLS